MDSRPATPGEFTVRADEKVAFSGPHGLVVSRTGKGAEVADVPWNIRCGNIRYNASRWKGVCQALNSDLLTPKGINPEIQIERPCSVPAAGLKGG
jgi:hypothetical protein